MLAFLVQNNDALTERFPIVGKRPSTALSASPCNVNEVGEVSLLSFPVFHLPEGLHSDAAEPKAAAALGSQDTERAVCHIAGLLLCRG